MTTEKTTPTTSAPALQNYVLLIHASEARFEGAPREDGERLMQAYGDYTRAIVATNKTGDCAPLSPSHTATSIRIRDGKRVVKDGPFAETREQLGGYYTLAGVTEEEALAWAERLPSAAFGTIEVRPVHTASGVIAPSPSDGDARARDDRGQYLLLVYEDSEAPKPSEEEQKAVTARYMEVARGWRERGALIASDRLAPPSSAKSLTIESTRRVVRDGPFAETRETLGGYFRVFARDLDEAIQMAAELPGAARGTIEARPVLDVRRYA